MIELGQKLSHRIKSEKLRHTHCHVNGAPSSHSQPILISSGLTFSTSESALTFMIQKCQDEKSLSSLIALPIKYSRGFGALELFKMQLSENTEKIHTFYATDLKTGILTSFGSKVLALISYTSIICLILYVLFDFSSGSFGDTTWLAWVLTVGVMISFVAVFLRSQINIKITKYLIRSKGQAERSSPAATMITTWLNEDNSMPIN